MSYGVWKSALPVNDMMLPRMICVLFFWNPASICRKPYSMRYTYVKLDTCVFCLCQYSMQTAKGYVLKGGGVVSEDFLLHCISLLSKLDVCASYVLHIRKGN